MITEKQFVFPTQIIVSVHAKSFI